MYNKLKNNLFLIFSGLIVSFLGIKAAYSSIRLNDLIVGYASLVLFSVVNLLFIYLLIRILINRQYRKK